jgi:hypothetical protein
VRLLIYVQLLAALLTASWDLAYVAWFHGMADLRTWFGILEFVSITTFLVSFLFPVLTFVVGSWAGLKGNAFRWVIFTTFAITIFQFWTILPMCQ